MGSGVDIWLQSTEVCKITLVKRLVGYQYLKDICEIWFILEYWFVVIPVYHNDGDFLFDLLR